ncbi:MAG: hypothetical protein IJA91_07555 [Clostridia bacterium]|nr:hypothetical protein [Clostridia bacterium]
MMKSMDYEWTSDTPYRKDYLYPQPEGLVSVRDILYTNRDGCRYVLLRWGMDADFQVDRFTFELTQLDFAEECLETVTVTYQGVDIPTVRQRECFVVPRGIALQEKCADIRVRLIELVSGKYIYRVKGMRVEVDYLVPMPWKYDERGGKDVKLSDKIPLRVYSKRRGRVGFRWPVVGLSVVLLILIMLLPVLFPGTEEVQSGGYPAETEAVDVDDRLPAMK